MIESYQLFLAIHIYSVYASGALMLLYLALTQGFKTEFDYIRRIRVFLPVYYLFFAIMLFTGLLLLSIKHYEWSFRAKYATAVWMLILGLSIWLFVLFKKARKMRRYRTFRMASFFILLFSMFLLALGFHIS